MLANNFLVVTLILSVLISLNFLPPVESAPFDNRHYNPFNQHPVVYRRYVRRRPPIYLHDQYMEDIIEIFDTKEKPPAYGALMTDEDVDTFIFCDFNRDSIMCKEYGASREPAKPSTEPTATTSASRFEMATKMLTVPQLDETEYIYSDEIQQAENNKDENGDYSEYDIEY